MRIKRLSHLILILFIGVLNLACVPSVDSYDASEPVSASITYGEKKGYNTLFMGHSFFIPVASGMAAHVERAGIIGHTQELVFSGGDTGAPQALWEDASKKAEVQALLDSGNIDLLAMTYHPSYPSIDGYKNWVAYALQKNPDTKFLIALPWWLIPTELDAETYAGVWTDAHPSIVHEHIDALRSAYPDNNFYCVPYGEGAGELYKLYEQGNLTDVNSLVSRTADTSIFVDDFGHANNILVDLSRLIWLQSIYNIDLNAYDYDPTYTTDLKVMAADIMSRHESAYDAS